MKKRQIKKLQSKHQKPTRNSSQVKPSPLADLDKISELITSTDLWAVGKSKEVIESSGRKGGMK